MYNVSKSYLDAYKTPSRRIVGSVECETQEGTITMAPNGSLVSFIIEKTAPKGKLFGFAVSQKITIEAIGILDTIRKGDKLIPSIECSDYTAEQVLLPYFYVDTIEFNKVKNRTIINGYDILHKMDSILIKDYTFTYPVNSRVYSRAILEPLGCEVIYEGILQTIKEAPNMEGNESVRNVLAALAEFTGSICYVSKENTVKFRGITAEDFTDVVTPANYFDLTIGEQIQLTQVASATELGDTYTYGSEGFTQVMWENPFLNMRTDVSELVESIGQKVLNTTCIAYNLSWRGCPAYELGDFIVLQEKDGTARFTRYLNERIVYGGGLKVTSNWEAVESESVDAAPPTLGETLKQVYAKVDKVNKQIDLVVSEKVREAIKNGEFNGDIEEIIDEKVSKIEIDTESIKASVMESTQDIIDSELVEIKEQVSMNMTKDEVEILIEQNKSTGAESVQTSTGYTFNQDGLNISKKGSEINTTITEDGITVYRDDDPVLIANNEGVKAEDLHATTYLIIGINSRFEDYDNGKRTGCFWIGD
jgi:hypothetical protein